MLLIVFQRLDLQTVRCLLVLLCALLTSRTQAQTRKLWEIIVLSLELLWHSAKPRRRHTHSYWHSFSLHQHCQILCYCSILDSFIHRGISIIHTWLQMTPYGQKIKHAIAIVVPKFLLYCKLTMWTHSRRSVNSSFYLAAALLNAVIGITCPSVWLSLSGSPLFSIMSTKTDLRWCAFHQTVVQTLYFSAM